MLTEFLKAYSDLPELNGLSDTLALVGLDSEHEAQLVRTILINGLCSGIKTYARNSEYAGAVHLLSLSDALTVLERLFEPEEEIVPAVPVRESAKVQMEPEAPVIEAEPEPVIEPVQEEERIPDHKEEPSSEPVQEEKSVVDDLEALASLNSQTTAVRAAGRAGNGPGFHGRK